LYNYKGGIVPDAPEAEKPVTVAEVCDFKLLSFLIRT